MKSRILSLFIIMSFAGMNAKAQKLDIGIKAGADLVKLEGATFKEGFSFGYHVGAFAKIGLSKKIAIQPEVQWSQVNVDTTNSFSDVYQFNNLSRVKLGYLRVPILLDYKIFPMVSLQAGPQFGILIDHNLSLLQNGQDAFKKGDFAMLGGIQVKFTKLIVYGRYAVGLSDINDIDNKDKWKSQSIQFGLGLAF